MSASVSLRRGGQPSTTTPTPPPWDSPQVVMRNSWPNVFAMNRECGKTGNRSNLTWDAEARKETGRGDGRRCGSPRERAATDDGAYQTVGKASVLVAGFTP